MEKRLTVKQTMEERGAGNMQKFAEALQKKGGLTEEQALALLGSGDEAAIAQAAAKSGLFRES